jgi:hypothetical protein
MYPTLVACDAEPQRRLLFLTDLVAFACCRTAFNESLAGVSLLDWDEESFDKQGLSIDPCVAPLVECAKLTCEHSLLCVCVCGGGGGGGYTKVNSDGIKRS